MIFIVYGLLSTVLKLLEEAKPKHRHKICQSKFYI